MTTTASVTMIEVHRSYLIIEFIKSVITVSSAQWQLSMASSAG